MKRLLALALLMLAPTCGTCAIKPNIAGIAAWSSSGMLYQVNYTYNYVKALGQVVSSDNTLHPFTNLIAGMTWCTGSNNAFFILDTGGLLWQGNAPGNMVTFVRDTGIVSANGRRILAMGYVNGNYYVSCALTAYKRGELWDLPNPVASNAGISNLIGTLIEPYTGQTPYLYGFVGKDTSGYGYDGSRNWWQVDVTNAQLTWMGNASASPYLGGLDLGIDGNVYSAANMGSNSSAIFQINYQNGYLMNESANLGVNINQIAVMH